jgi:hypothetical protein
MAAAQAALARLSDRAQVAGSDWALGGRRRCKRWPVDGPAARRSLLGRWASPPTSSVCWWSSACRRPTRWRVDRPGGGG